MFYFLSSFCGKTVITYLAFSGIKSPLFASVRVENEPTLNILFWNSAELQIRGNARDFLYYPLFFHISASRSFTRPQGVSRVLEQIQSPLSQSDLLVFREDQQEFGHNEEETFLDWSAVPPLVHPTGGELPAKRLVKKCQQLECLAAAVVRRVAARHGGGWRPRVVDFCSGGGHLGILLAHLMPNAEVVLVENKEDSLRRAADRITKQGELSETHSVKGTLSLIAADSLQA